MSASASTGFKWQHLLMMAGGAAAAGGVLYYLLREDEKSESSSSLKKKSHSEYTRDDVLKILSDISGSQEQMKTVMKDLTKDLISQHLNFEETYQRVKKVQPEDPLERHNVTMQEFDMILERYQADPAVRGAITSIMGAPSASTVFSPKAKEVKKDTIIKIHEFMLVELKKLVETFDKLDRQDFDMKTVTIAAQALVGAKVEEEFGLTSDDIESAVLLFHQALTADTNFARINVEMQSTMSQLMGQQFPSGYPL